MTLTEYRTTKLPTYYFNEIEEFVRTSGKYVSVSEFLRLAIEEKLDNEKKQKRNDVQFLLFKDMVFTKTRLNHIHDAICETARVDNRSILKDNFEQVTENSIDTSMYRFLAKFLLNFMKFHPFTDGNKRTALTAVDVFLRLNNKKLEMESKPGKKTEDEKFIWQASIQQKSSNVVEEFLEKHAKPYLSSNDFETEMKRCLEENRQLLENLSE